MAQEPCYSRTLALRNDIWVPSIRACRSIYDNTTVCDILEPPTHALPTTWRHTAKRGWGHGLRAGPHLWRGSPCGEGRFMHVTGIAYLEL